MLDEETYFLKMHPIICDVVKDQLKPDQESCKQYIIGVWKDFSGPWYRTQEERAEKWPYVDHIQRYYGTPIRELWMQYADFVNIAWICSQFAQSIAASKDFYQYTLQEFGDAGYKPCFAARAIAGAYFNSGDEKSAEPYYYLALEHMLKKPEEDYRELGLIYEKVGRCAYTNGDYDKAKEYLDDSLKYHAKARTVPGANIPIISFYFYTKQINH